MYDGFLEQVCIKMGLPVVSQSERQVVFQTATKLTKAKLMAHWKGNESPLNKGVTKYKPEPEPEALPENPEDPTLRLCSLDGGVLILPRDVRSQFLTDPVRAPEWRGILQEFDRCYGSASTESAESEVIAAGDASAPTAEQGLAAMGVAAEFEFPTETTADWHARCDANVKAKFNWCPEISAYLVPKPDQGDDEMALEDFELYVEATAEYTIGKDEPFLTYGAGSWLQDAGKVDAFLENAPPNHRAVNCCFTSDADLVVLEAGKLHPELNNNLTT